MSRIFYRYIRPLKFNTKMLDFDIMSNGGVCLRFERNFDNRALFTYSRCHADDHFNKKVAKSIADSRAQHAKCNPDLLDVMCVDLSAAGESTEDLVDLVIRHCMEFDPDQHSCLISRYLDPEWKGLAESLQALVKRNAREIDIARVWLEAAKLIEARTQYIKINLTPLEDAHANR